MTMIAVGQGLRGIANRGMAAVAKAESVEEQQRLAIEAQRSAAEAQTMGTGAGIGGMVGASKLAAASKIGETAASATGDAVMQGGKLFINQSPAAPTVAELALNPSAGALASPVGTTGSALTAEGLVAGGAKELAAQEGSKALLSQAAGSTTTAAGSTAAGAGSTAAGAAGASGSGAMATLSTLAAPVAIGLGVAFLLNKLFD